MLIATATDVPRLRDQLIELICQPDGLLAAVFNNHKATGKPLMFPVDPLTGRQFSIPRYMDQLARWHRSAELFYVTPDMSEVVRAAAKALPVYDLQSDALPADVGLVVWGQPATIATEHPGNDLREGQRIEIRAALWARVADIGIGQPGVLLVTWQDSDVLIATGPGWSENEVLARFGRRYMGPLAYHEEYPLPYGNRPYGSTKETLANEAVAAALTTWIMMGQRITTESTAQPNRTARRQAERAGAPPPRPVRIVTLRRAAPKQRPDTTPPEGAKAARVYKHQWPVTGYGYWRNTWYPSAQEHRVQFVYVPTYMKGPADAPLIGGERVNVLRR